jgi:hypothetical protein
MTQGLSFRQGFVRSRVAAVSLVAAALGVLVAGGASGASTLSIIPDASTYTVGDTISLNLVVGGGLAPFDPSTHETVMAAALALSGSGEATMLSATQMPMTKEECHWLPEPDCSMGLAHLNPLDIGANGVIDQLLTLVSPDFGITAPNPLATATFTATSPGQVTFGFNAATFDFFGAAPTSTATIEILPIPEPGTATLVGMGLASLSVWGRKRRVG